MYRTATLLVALCIATAAPVRADTYTVDDTGDAPDADTVDNNCLTAGGMCSLRAAVQQANAHPGADEIVMPPGLYKLSLVGAGEENAASGDLDVLDDLVVTGSGIQANNVVVDGNGSDRVFDIKPGAVVTLARLDVRSGVAITDPRGGGILNAGTLLLDRVVVEGNHADNGAGSGSGGGIYNLATLTISGSAILTNVVSPAATATGGGIYNSGTMTVVNSTVGYNCGIGDASQGSGVGIYNAAGGSTDLRNATIAFNGDSLHPTMNGAGSGVYNAAGSVTLENSVIADNFSNPSQDCAGTLTSGGYNLVEDASGCLLAGDMTGVQIGVDPLFNAGELRTDFGPTPLIHPNASSPLIDAGNPALAGSGAGACEAHDQRGYTRAMDATRCDIGSEELGRCLPRLTPLTLCNGHQQLPGRGKIDLKNYTDDTKDGLHWTFARGSATSDSAFGAGADDYTFCIYDQSGPVLEAGVPGGGVCAGNPCWTDIVKGLKYKNAAATPDGLTRIKFTSGNSAKVDAKGSGPDLKFVPPPWFGTVTVRMEDESAPTPQSSCWEATYSAPMANTIARFKARGD